MATTRTSAQADMRKWVAIGVAGFALLIAFVMFKIMFPAKPPLDPRTLMGPQAEVEEYVTRFIEDIKTSGLRPPRMSEPRAGAVLRQATDRARLSEISNLLRLRSACLSAEALLGVYRKPRPGVTEKNVQPNVTLANGAIGSLDPAYLDEVGLLAGFVVRCLGTQIIALERLMDSANGAPLDRGQMDVANKVKTAVTATMDNLFNSGIPEYHMLEFRTYAQFADATTEYAVVYSRALPTREREKILEKSGKYIEKTPPYMRDTALRINRAFGATECVRLCRLK